MANRKERIKSVLLGKSEGRIPVFPLLMSFSAKRIGRNYKEFALDGRVMAEAQINASEMFEIDAITACSDAFRIAADLGADMVYPIDGPPFSSKSLVKCLTDLQLLKRPDPSNPKSRMNDRTRGVAEMARNVGKEVLVVGWVDMPFAEACSLCGVQNMLMMLYDEPILAHSILEFLTPIVIEFALMQIESGAEMIGCGDAAASLISPDLYREFVLPYEKRVCDAIHRKNIFIKLHICGNTTALLNDMAESGADLFNVDHLVDLEKAARCYGAKGLALKGNLNPVSDMLDSTPAECFKKARSCIETAKGYNYILSPGCEVPEAVSDEVFHSFCLAAV